MASCYSVSSCCDGGGVMGFTSLYVTKMISDNEVRFNRQIKVSIKHYNIIRWY